MSLPEPFAERNKAWVALLASLASFATTICLIQTSRGTLTTLWSTPAIAVPRSSVSIALGSRSPVQHLHPNAVESQANAANADGEPAASYSSSTASPSAPTPALVGLALISAALTAAVLYFRPHQPRETAWATLLTAGQRPTLGPLRAEEWRPDMGTNLSGMFSTAMDDDAPKRQEQQKESEQYFQDIPLESEVGVDYGLLKQLLADKQWEEADNEHRRLLIELAGPAAEGREYVWPGEATKIPLKDMQMLDRLWVNYSGGKFGFSVQRKLWAGVRGNWTDFFKRVNWVQGENNDYRKWPKQFLYTLEAERGHLPLTNTLRGTGLIQAIFEHEAFGGPLKNKQVRK